MNYDNLTPKEALALYISSGFGDIEFEKRKLEISKGSFFVKNYRNTKGSTSYIKGQFRGFLGAGPAGWMENLYW